MPVVAFVVVGVGAAANRPILEHTSGDVRPVSRFGRRLSAVGGRAPSGMMAAAHVCGGVRVVMLIATTHSSDN